MAHTFLEFFCGGGMAREGLGEKWRCMFANDLDERKAASYLARWSQSGVCPELKVDDISNLRVEDLPCERADLAWASFPCQDLSLAGFGAGLAGERSGAFLPFHFLMRDLRQFDRAPKVIVLENVCGLLTSNGGRDFADIVHMTQQNGYAVTSLVMDAIDFLPQSRPRLFIVAFDKSGPLPRAAIGPSAHWHPLRLQQAHAALRRDLKEDWLWVCPSVPATRRTRFADIIEAGPGDVPWHSPEETAKLLSMMSSANRAKIAQARKSGQLEVGCVYKRTRIENGVKCQRAEVRFDDVAGCLRTPSGGSSRQNILIVNGEEPVRSRLISARETARLMGLPEDYPLPRRYNDAYHLTGDGVAVPVVRWLASEVIEPVVSKVLV